MQESSTRIIYDFQSFFYDATFGRMVRRRIADGVQRMNTEPGHRVLDLGIGTGASLAHYPAHCNVVGIDLSPGMLRECRKKIIERGLTHVQLFQADALHLPFEDDSFDQVFISHVITVVSDPVQLVREAQRVAKPHAKIVMVNHFQSTNRLVALFEKWLCPLCTKMGWRSDLALNELVKATGLTIDYRYKLESIDLWEIVVTSNDKSSLRDRSQEPEPAIPAMQLLTPAM